MNRSTSSLLIIPVVAFLMGNQGARAGNILGFAVDSTSGAPIHGVTVSAKDAGTSSDWVRAATDQDGHFELTGLGEGQYTVVFSHVGFVTKVVDSCRVSGTAISGALVAELVPAVINVNAISVTASRRPEKVVEAPASVAVLDSTCIQSKTTLSTAEHLKTLPAVDAVATGINSSSVVVRGFNNVFSTTLLSMIDNRLTHVPSLRVNAYQFVPIVNEDVDRIELVLGPGSALYGPNCTDGVMHIVTKSPFASSGTLVSVAGGERDFAFGSFRTSGRISENLAARLSGQYYQAEDWKVFDPAEPDSVILFRQTPDGNRYEAAAIDNARDFETEKISFDGRLDWAVSDEAMIITNAGFNRASNIELTDLGAAQAVDWSYGYGQVRFTYKDLFVQGFVNMSDAGDTYLRRSGAMIIDNSRFWVGQIQHAFRLGRRQSFTYGLDAYFTRPSTEGTLNGRNEDRDNINEYGVYLQSESRLTPWMKFVVAGRLDDHSLVEKPIFSPRAALAFQPAPSHNFRITYNRAYSTPGTPNFFLDILSASVPTDDPVL
ncbi:MAG: TonB-dependent receptor [Candidatus Zixiibacteriota bacterium]|nr:MAG: TonB-dependent receptor [candidate division Zixibacteria bacterium]